MATIRDEERERIENKHGVKCVICACPPNEMIDANSTEVPLYAIDQDDSNISPENMVPMCSSCVWHCVHVDKAPYQFYHRQIPLYKRKIVDSAYTGPQISRRDALEYVYEKESDVTSSAP